LFPKDWQGGLQGWNANTSQSNVKEEKAMTPDKAMSLANDLECTIATLREIADELRTAYTDNDYRDYGDAEQEAAPSEAPTPKPPSLEEVRAILADKSRNGASARIKELLGKYDAEKLSEVSPDDYIALLKDAEGIVNG